MRVWAEVVLCVVGAAVGVSLLVGVARLQQHGLTSALGTLPSYGELRRDAAPRRPGRALEAPAAAPAPTP